MFRCDLPFRHVESGSSGTMQVSSLQTIKALASKPGLTDSFVASSGQYTTMGEVSKPVLSPGGYYDCGATGLSVTISSTSGATIKYTINDATPPSHTYGTLYAGPFVVTPTTAGVTVEAISYKTGMTDSPIAYGYYELIPPSDCHQGNDSGPPPDGTTAAPTYGANGNMTTNLDGSVYVYDAQSRLLSASKAGVSETFYYDGLNRQVARAMNGGVATYTAYDGWNLVVEYTAGVSLPSNAWLYGPEGIVKELTSDLYYYQDGSGSTSHVADGTGNLLEWYRYDLQGVPVVYNPGGSILPNGSAYGVDQLFTGQKWHSALGLYDLRNRYYSPDIGRFLQPDPIGFGGDASNLYRYCGNNPVNASDPSGETPVYHPGGGYFTYVTNPGAQLPNNGVDYTTTNQWCAAGCQAVSGAPDTKFWYQGSPVGRQRPLTLS